MTLTRRTALALAATSLIGASALAQTYPTRPIKLLIGFAAVVFVFEAEADVLLWCCPTPDFKVLLPLQHHAIADEAWQANLSKTQ